MEISEVSRLIPLYVAGSASEEEKRLVEDALARSVELRKELEFWKRAQAAVRTYDPAHPSAEMIADYAEGRITGSTRVTFETHLQVCADCQRELEIVRETYPAQVSAIDEGRYAGEVSALGLFTDFFRKIKVVYVVPAVVLTVLCVFVVVSVLSPKKEPPSIVVSQPPTTTEQHRSLVLQYRPQLRSASTVELPEIGLAGHVDVVDITVFVPRSIDSVRYTLSLITPSKTRTRVPGSFRASRYDESLDYVNAGFNRSLFETAGEYRIVATEQLPPSAGILPESYDYPFVVSLGSRK